MKGNLDEIVDLVMYKGPTISELIGKSTDPNNIIITNKMRDGNTEIIIESSIVYNVKIVDKYIYDLDEKLLKQSIVINGKEKVVFDKYEEILLKITDVNIA